MKSTLKKRCQKIPNLTSLLITIHHSHQEYHHCHHQHPSCSEHHLHHHLHLHPEYHHHHHQDHFCWRGHHDHHPHLLYHLHHHHYQHYQEDHHCHHHHLQNPLYHLHQNQHHPRMLQLDQPPTKTRERWKLLISSCSLPDTRLYFHQLIHLHQSQ